MRLSLSVYRSRIGVQWADPSVRPSCVVTPRYSRWFMDGRSAPLSRPRKGWDSKMYSLTLSRHESERTILWLSRPWRGGRGGVCNTPLRIRQEERLTLQLSHPQKEWDSKMYPQTLSRHESERAPLGLSRPWQVGLWGVCNTPLRIRQEEGSALGLSHPQKGWNSKIYPLTFSRHESERATLRLSRPWRGGLWGVCNTPLPCRKEEGSALWLFHFRKGWDSKMYPLTLSRHESERATLELFRPWWGGRWADVFAPLRIRQEERSALGLSRPRKEWDSKMYPLTLSRHESGRATLGLFRPWRVGLWGVCNTPLPCWKEERVTLWLSRSWRGGRGADIFATCPYSFLVTITPRLTFHF